MCLQVTAKEAAPPPGPSKTKCYPEEPVSRCTTFPFPSSQVPKALSRLGFHLLLHSGPFPLPAMTLECSSRPKTNKRKLLLLTSPMSALSHGSCTLTLSHISAERGHSPLPSPNIVFQLHHNDLKSLSDPDTWVKLLFLHLTALRPKPVLKPVTENSHYSGEANELTARSLNRIT